MAVGGLIMGVIMSVATLRCSFLISFFLAGKQDNLHFKVKVGQTNRTWLWMDTTNPKPWKPENDEGMAALKLIRCWTIDEPINETMNVWWYWMNLRCSCLKAHWIFYDLLAGGGRDGSSKSSWRDLCHKFPLRLVCQYVIRNSACIASECKWCEQQKFGFFRREVRDRLPGIARGDDGDGIVESRRMMIQRILVMMIFVVVADDDENIWHNISAIAMWLCLLSFLFSLFLILTKKLYNIEKMVV